ncbi:MAG: RdgB/HAM1 family non-canonical purine NTP pyrophosphatase [Synergistaceae bacterium]|nr:RdgB/HAM1 family non-canonical purine NTP pyrophosphatase [Synergistaceae bacterium]
MSLKKLLIATGNQGKYKEFKEIIKIFTPFSDSRELEIIFAPDLADLLIEETGKTYSENAMLKAQAWAKESGLPCLADDSGLEVEALDGAPGIFSARVVPGNDKDKISWLLSELKDKENRRARFAASLALCVPDEFILISQGFCSGTIAHSPKGSNGFGYDPLFIPEGFEKTFAELPSDIKNKISHRTNALKKIASFIL